MSYPFGTIVYHVANSQVPGVVVSVHPDNGFLRVIFKEPVGFSGNLMRGLQTDWGCSANLLWPTAAEADANDLYKAEKIAAQAAAARLAKKAEKKAKKKSKVKKPKSKKKKSRK